MHIAICVQQSLAQKVVQQYTLDAMLAKMPDTINYNTVGIAKPYAGAILIALDAYPELQHLNVIFRLRKQRSPLSANVNFWNIFRAKQKRVYLINISTQSTPTLTAILFSKLSFNAQIGVLGHELGHIAQYSKMSGFDFIGFALKHLSKNKIDQHEYSTDLLAIQHGLGYQLLAWSKEVRANLNKKEWGGSNNLKPMHERYMNPSTITRIMDSMPIYNKE